MLSTQGAVRVVVMGVSGCGKSTVGWLLARLLDVPFVDADGLHPAANVARMAAGTPLTDQDRWPWLRVVGGELARTSGGAVVACSALRRAYRDVLRESAPGTVFVHLTGSREQLATRMAARLDHFMPPSLLDTQLAALEPLGPDEAGITLDVAAAPDRIAADAAAWLRASSGADARVPHPAADAR